MKNNKTWDTLDLKTIIACSSGHSLGQNCAISLIRLSGKFELQSFQNFFSLNFNSIVPRKSYVTKLFDHNKKVIDEIVVVFFKSPQSFTGENILELSVHGNPINVQRILDLFVSTEKVRLARPGEFTYRAYQNKKLSLSQVEGLEILLNAHSEMILDEGVKLLHGKLHEEYLKLYQYYLELKAGVDIAIDFSEDVGDEESTKIIKNSLLKVFSLLKNLHERTQGTFSFFLNPEVILLGPPNSGKSSLFNALLNDQRSIVNSQAGTTRDTISEYIHYHGMNTRLVDTAGIRLTTRDEIEQEGVERSLRLQENSFFKILVLNPLLKEDYHSDFYQKNDFDLIIFTHTDVPYYEEAKERVLNLLKKKLPEVEISLLRYEGEPESGPIGPLLNKIKDCIYEKYHSIRSRDPILVERQRQAINKAYKNSQVFYKKVIEDGEQDLAIISRYTQRLGHDLFEIIGIIDADESLDLIFNRFCIGK